MAITQQTKLPLEYGEFRIVYHKTEKGDCVSVSMGELTTGTPIVRIHSSCLFGESFHGLDCDCNSQLASTFRLIADYGHGVIVYHYAEGRGVGLETKIQSLELQRTKGLDTVESLTQLGLPPDQRSYDAPVEALSDLMVSSTIQAATENPHKIHALEQAGFTIAQVLHPKVVLTKLNASERLVKKEKLGYLIEDNSTSSEISDPLRASR